MLSLRFFLPLALALAAHAADVPTVDLGYARYEGSVDTASNVSVFLGVRYAAPPIGNRRWAAPQKPAYVAGTIQATAQPSRCYQSGNGKASTTPFRPLVSRDVNAVSEDCLFLNVYTPETVPASSAKLPVVVWIHGGGYIAGYASYFSGLDLVRESGNQVVAVVIQYRLGLFGFLPGAAVKSGGALNAGLLDQEFALRWVQDHISQFGGDKDQVTIWGESAGAGAVIQQVIARDGSQDPPLFRGAITSSTFLPSQYNYDDEIPEELFAEVVERAGCASSSEELQCLRGVDVDTLQAANTDINTAGFYGTYVFVPVVDGEFIVRRPTESLAMGKTNGEVVLAVSNSDEGSRFVNQTIGSTTNATAYALNLFPAISVELATEIAKLYSNVGDTLTQLNTIQAEAIFICPTYYLLDAFPTDSFKGLFAIAPGTHGSDVSYYFPSGPPPAYNNTAFLTAFSGAFLNFVVSLDPNVKLDPSNITPQWNTYSNHGADMLFNKTDTSEPVVLPISTPREVLKRCKFWKSIGELTGQ